MKKAIQIQPEEFYVSRQIFNLLAKRHFDDRKQENGDVIYLLDEKPVMRRVAEKHNLVYGGYRVDASTNPWIITPAEGDNSPLVLNMDVHDKRVWPSFDVDLDPAKPGFKLKGRHITVRFQ